MPHEPSALRSVPVGKEVDQDELAAPQHTHTHTHTLSLSLVFFALLQSGLIDHRNATCDPKAPSKEPLLLLDVVVDASKKTDDYLVLSVDGTNVPPPFVLVREELWLSVIGTAPFLAWARSHTSRPGDPEPGTTVHQWPHSITVPQVFSPGYDATVIVLARRPGGELLNLVIELPASMLTLIPAPEKKQLKSTTAKGALFDLYAAKVAAFDELLLDLTEELDALPEAERAELYGVLNATALGQ